MDQHFLFPISGTLLPLEQCPEPIFADKTLGDGFVIKFTGHELRAPFAGVVIAAFPAGHAFIIRNEKADVEVMLHVGLNSAHKEEAFSAQVKKYQKVKAGQILTLVKPELFDQNNDYCPVLFSDPRQKFELKKSNQQVLAGDLDAVQLSGV